MSLRRTREASRREADDPGGGRSGLRLVGGMHCGAELPSSSDAGTASLYVGGPVAGGRSQGLDSQRSVVGGLQRRRAYRLRETTAGGQSVSECSERSP